ncbi:helix-turn-helix domain-containing protein [Mycoplasma sp. P36-A1]|uniref:helix-turn-helix domain-containing protein n=1 Tax=Mycoplasma sp. P36-A1 TaxID=3252900 RepID=UPI003C2C0CE5
MGRKAKFSFEIKMKTVLDIVGGVESVSNAAYRLTVNESTIRRWLNKYISNGEQALITNKFNKSYSTDLKNYAINDYINGLGSLNDIIGKYNISSISILQSWINKYNNHIETKAHKPLESNGVYMKDNNKYTYDQKLAIAKYCIENSLNYIDTASKYKTSYSNVYNWTRKYLKDGVDGLKDNRGRKKDDSELDEIELLQRDNSRLKRELELKELENKILKKLEEKERSVLLSRRKMK